MFDSSCRVSVYINLILGFPTAGDLAFYEIAPFTHTLHIQHAVTQNETRNCTQPCHNPIPTPRLNFGGCKESKTVTLKYQENKANKEWKLAHTERHIHKVRNPHSDKHAHKRQRQ